MRSSLIKKGLMMHLYNTDGVMILRRRMII